MEPFNWIITQKKGEYYYVPTNLYDFFFLQHTPARRQGITGTVWGCRDARPCVSTVNAMWDFFPPRGGAAKKSEDFF